MGHPNADTNEQESLAAGESDGQAESDRIIQKRLESEATVARVDTDSIKTLVGVTGAIHLLANRQEILPAEEAARHDRHEASSVEENSLAIEKVQRQDSSERTEQERVSAGASGSGPEARRTKTLVVTQDKLIKNLAPIKEGTDEKAWKRELIITLVREAKLGVSAEKLMSAYNEREDELIKYLYMLQAYESFGTARQHADVERLAVEESARLAKSERIARQFDFESSEDERLIKELLLEVATPENTDASLLTGYKEKEVDLSKTRETIGLKKEKKAKIEQRESSQALVTDINPLQRATDDLTKNVPNTKVENRNKETKQNHEITRFADKRTRQVSLSLLQTDRPATSEKIEQERLEAKAEEASTGISYLEGEFVYGFRKMADLEDDKVGCRLYRMMKKPSEQTTRCFQVPLKCSSLNDGDAFLLDAGETIYTWFGSSVSGFEKNRSATIAHDIRQDRHTHGSCECILDVEDDNEDFWELLGGKGKTKPCLLDSFLQKMASS